MLIRPNHSRWYNIALRIFSDAMLNIVYCLYTVDPDDYKCWIDNALEERGHTFFYTGRTEKSH
jgi:hypothetical protein